MQRASFSLPTGILACGPWFPNTLLDKGDIAVLGAPRANFQRELERMKLLAPAAATSMNRPVDSREADVADLRAALERLHTLVRSHLRTSSPAIPASGLKSP